MRLKSNQGIAVALHSAVSSLAGPTNLTTDNSYGGDISAWLDGGKYSFGNSELELTAGGATTLTSGALIAKISTTGPWVKVGDLYGGATITLSAVIGWSRLVGGVGMYGRLGLVGAVAVSTLTARIIPVEFTEIAG